MIQGFCITGMILVVFMAVCIVKMGRIKKEIVNTMRFLFVVAILTVLCNIAAVLAVQGTEYFAMLMHGLYFALTDWLVVALFYFAKHYTGYFEKNKTVIRLFSLASIADTVSLLANLYFKHIFYCEWTEIHQGSLEYSCYAVHTQMPGYLSHILIVYSMALFVIGVFFVKARKTIKLYRRKYDVILYSFVIILGVNILYRFVNIAIDISVIFYVLLAIAIGYFGLLYIPKGLTVRLLSFSVKDMSMGILCFDLQGNCIYVNDMAKRLFGQEQCKGYEFFENYYADWLEEQGDEELVDTTWREQQIEGEKISYYETKFKRLLDDDGNFVGAYFSIVDMTEEITKYERELYRATHDELTGIYNRAGFMEQTHMVLENDPDTKRCIMCVDVKDFKLYNEMFGVKAGDKLLIKIAGIMRKEYSENIVYGRLSGDRFAVCMPVDRFDEQRITNYIKTAAEKGGNDVYHVHIQLGIYFITDPAMDVSVMCDRGMMAIQSIKQDYQKYAAYYDEKLGDQLHKEKKLLSGFEEAMEDGQFRIYLQPQIAADGTLLGAEALVRWVHPVDGLIPPIAFIPLFEQTGYIHKLDMCVWELACRQLAQWKKMGREDLHISVNISAKDFYYIDLYETFTGLVKKHEIAPKNLKLEITETAVMTEMSKQLKLLDRLREFGFHIEIDDFGSGYSSLNTLKDMNVDVVKMDMGFLKKTEHQERSRIIMDAMIAMSKKLGIAVITEGVETEEQVAFLKTAGCDMFQGYYFDKPMPVEQFEEKYQLS